MIGSLMRLANTIDVAVEQSLSAPKRAIAVKYHLHRIVYVHDGGEGREIDGEFVDDAAFARRRHSKRGLFVSGE
jgi:hypothetical protein